jgi:tagatose 1,6-diphosphate aldolase GatY/KbaY
MKLQDKLLELSKEKKALLAANFYNFETLSGILKAASIVNTPVILQLSESSIKYLGLSVATNMARAAIKEYNVNAWLHLDHGCSIETIKRCLDAGFDSVMIDASERPINENIDITLEVVEIASKYGACVESELGFVAKLGQEPNEHTFTLPEDAKYFVEKTKVNALAVAVGSSHGFYKKEPKLDINLLSRIKNCIPTPLVLHGSSGIPDFMLQEAIRNGICKVNLATEIKQVFMIALRECLNNNSEIDLRIVFPKAITAVSTTIINKLRLVLQA